MSKIFESKLSILLLAILFFGAVAVIADTIGDSGFSGIQVDNYYSGNGNAGIDYNFSVMGSDDKEYMMIIEDGLVVNISLEEDFPLQGLLSYYSFDSGVSDDHGSNSGTNQGTTQVGGKISNARDFDGSNDYIDLGWGINSDIETENLTINAWLNADSNDATNRRAIYLGRSSVTSEDFIQIATEGGVVKGYFREGNSGLATLNSGTMNTGQWYMVTLVRHGTTAELYINGSSVDSLTNGEIGVDINITSPKTIFGEEPINNLHYDGKIDEIGIWNRVLSASEISDLYNAGSGLAYPN